jgi:predicted membrane-bound spermidine synthase
VKTTEGSRAKRNTVFRRRLVQLNRRMAWMAMLPLVVVSTGAFYALPDSPSWLAVLTLAAYGMLALHLLAAIYLFGIPKPSLGLKAIFVYCGYAFLASSVLSLFVYGQRLYYTAALVASWAFLAAHVGLGAQFALSRRLNRTDRASNDKQQFTRPR